MAKIYYDKDADINVIKALLKLLLMMKRTLT